ncbi:MAG: tungsten formylmethanofuran dehydrogenase [Calditrichae bacterium]|nr:dehydrogenase E1 component subunit alpha/beta [Calditrichota bacterium]MCB9057951.1 tungsten formylmethanofuran dehydrogenase [Calditrichia bacterium]
MVISRFLDEKMLIMLKQGKSFFHIGASGHEAVQTAAAFAMRTEYDYAYPYYRDLAFALQFGMTPLENMLLFLARADDPSSGGRQMSNHYGNRKKNIITQSSPTGTQYLQAVGAAMAAKKRKTDEIVYVSSGEGTTSQGDFHEALNWATRDKLPVLFLIENNQYAISVHVSEQTTGSSISKIGSGYEGLETGRIDGTDFFKSYDVLKKTVKHVRDGLGPALIEADTVRLMAHSSSDSDKKYRTKEELEADKKKDPIIRFEHELMDQGICTQDEINELKKSYKKEVDQAADDAEAHPAPATDSLYNHLLSDRDELEYEKTEPSGNNVVLVDAINHALKEEMERNRDIYIFGQDVADNKGGVFTATQGISTKFGRERCFNAPLAESSIVGVGIGMATVGLKPVIEVQFADYIWTAMMQIRNELSTIRWRSNGNWSAPVVIRVPVGGYIHGALCHSQNIEAIFGHLPGLKIAYPSNAADAKGLLKSAIRGDDPVLFLEHKGLYRQSYAASPEPDADYLLPYGKARIAMEGTDITVITWGALVQKSLEAARELKKQGVSIEVIDIRTINPLDSEMILSSVKKTGKVLVAHEDTRFQGFGAEIAAQIAEFAFEYLDAPVKRIAGEDTPIPFSPVLEEVCLPQTGWLRKALQELAAY